MWWLNSHVCVVAILAQVEPAICGQQMRIGGLADFSAHPPPMTEKEKMMDDHYVRVNQMRVSSNYDELTFGDDDTPEPQRALKM